MAFVPYLTSFDYLPSIQREQLNDQILDELEGGFERKRCESWAMGKIRGKISDEFDVEYEFRETLPFDINKTYGAGSGIIHDYPEWESGKEYLGEQDLVIFDGNAYLCLIDNSDIDFDDSKWQGVGKEKDIFYIPLPYPRFSLETFTSKNGNPAKGVYKTGDMVWWIDHNYEAIKPTRIFTQQESINYQTYKSIGAPNVFPNIPNNGYWNDLGVVQFLGDIPFYSEGENQSVWVLGDNRDPVFVQAVIDLALFQLHKRIAPNNIPKLRIEAMQYTFDWLQNVSVGTETVDIEPNQPKQGKDISWGSKPKSTNGY